MDNCVLYIDAANPKSWSQNVHPNPLDVGSWAVPAGAYQATLSRDTTVTDSPTGGIPLKMAVSSATPNSAYVGTYNSSTWNLAPAVQGQTWTVSYWVKGSSAFSASMLIFEANSSGNYTTYGQTYYNVTTGWTRVTGTYTTTQATTAYIQVRFDNYNASTNMWVDGIQVELGSTATTFNPKTNSNRANLYSQDSNAVIGTTYGVVTYNSTDGGGCFDFSAVTGASSAAASLGFTFSSNMIPTYGNFTFSCWVKNPPSAGQIGLFSNSGGGDGYRFGAMTTGTYVLCGMPYNETSIPHVSSWDNSLWHNVVAVFDRQGLETGSPRVVAYLDGVYQGAMSLSAPQVGSTSAAPGLVRSACCSLYTGKLALFTAWKGHLTSTEVTSLYNVHRGRFGR
jgi:hypothetical protein